MTKHRLIHIIRRLKKIFSLDPNRFLKRVSGVIHVGANRGGEGQEYDRHGLRVVWVEPIPEVFAELEKNVAEYPNQRAIRALVTDKNGAEYRFHVASNHGESSSIFNLGEHQKMFPDVSYDREISLRSVTLEKLDSDEEIDINRYQAMVLDTQGSELLILKGAGRLLGSLTYIKVEVADFEAYEGCCQLKEVGAFLRRQGFREFSRVESMHHEDAGSYFDVVYERNSVG